MAKVKQAYKTYAIVLTDTVTEEVLDEIAGLTQDLEEAGYILRIGGEETDDTAVNALTDQTKMEVFLPWEGYNDWDEPVKPMAGAYEIAWKYHPNWQDLTEDDRRIHARTSHVIMGADLKSPVDFLICFTDPESEINGDIEQAVRIADSELKPVFDFKLGLDYTYNHLEQWIQAQ